MFKVIEPYSQYKTNPNQLVLSVKTGRHGTLKVVIEAGEALLKKAGWKAGETYIDAYVGTDDDTGLVRLQKGTSYKVRSMRNGRTGQIIMPAAALFLLDKHPRTVCEWSNDNVGRIYVMIRGLS